MTVPSYYEQNDEECVYDLVPNYAPAEPKPPMYRSKSAPKPNSSFGKANGQHSNFG